MGYTSYSEDIVKRHQSDIHDLMRELEEGQISKTQQTHALPELKELVEKLGSILSDPFQPVAMRLLDIRSKASNLELVREQLAARNSELGKTNSRLNDELRREGKALESERKASRRARKDLAVAKAEMDIREQQIDKLNREVATLRAQIVKLELLAFEAQAEIKY